jgi:hypothetical protein
MIELPKETEPLISAPVAQKEKSTAILLGKMTKHTVIVRKGITFLIIFSILALYAAMYLIHMESVDRHLQSPVFKILVR